VVPAADVGRERRLDNFKSLFDGGVSGNGRVPLEAPKERLF
jgi:hypothetical protein